MYQPDFVGGDSELTERQILDQMETMLRSKHFTSAKSLERFLRYIVLKKLAGATHELKEYTIGVEVYRRGDDFDPRLDAVVRVQASMLRKKLAWYYEEEGAADEVLIELPKGHYVPRFARRPKAPGLSPPVEALTSPAVIVEPPGRRRWSGLLRLAATFLVGLLTALTLQQWRGVAATPGAAATAVPVASEPKKEAIDPALLPLWGKFLEPGATNVLAYGTPQFFNAGGVYLRDVEVNSAGEAGGGKRLRLLQKNLPQSLTPIEIYTGVGETHGVYLLSRFFWQAARELRVARSRMVGWEDVKNCNLIFLSSMRFHTLAKELPFPTDFVIAPSKEARIINLHPRAGERPDYSNQNGEYAVITIWPGKSPHRRVMVLSGTTTWATLAAAEYVTELDHLRELNEQLARCREQAGTAEHPPFFQILVRAEVKDNQPVSISYVTHHDLAISAGEAKTAELASLRLN